MALRPSSYRSADTAARNPQGGSLDPVVRAEQDGTVTVGKDTGSAGKPVAAAKAVGDYAAQSNWVLGNNPTMRRIARSIQRAAEVECTVLVSGETGTGKELWARLLHRSGPRSDKAFIPVNCAALTPALAESQLFGHEKGAFTGAQGKSLGIFRAAQGGVVFLDEIGEMPLELQAKMLRLLQQREVMPVGSTEPVHVDVQVVAATNRNLEEESEKGTFREDLYYRLNIFPIELPPLRARREDIPLLMRHFLDEIGLAYDREPPMVSEEALDLILAYRWPGNVRQLRALCERWVIVRPGKRIEREHLPAAMTQDSDPAPSGLGSFAIDEARPMADNTDRVLRQIERAYLYQQLRRNEGRMDRTAEAAGISRRTLYTKMKLYSLDAADFRRS